MVTVLSSAVGNPRFFHHHFDAIGGCWNLAGECGGQQFDDLAPSFACASNTACMSAAGFGAVWVDWPTGGGAAFGDIAD